MLVVHYAFISINWHDAFLRKFAANGSRVRNSGATSCYEWFFASND